MTHTDFDTIELSDVSVDDILNSKLIVYNDDHNSFEWVIECFCKYLKHSSEQAEQCALLIHTKGKCDVKTGSKEDLKPFKEALTDAGLSAVIE
jgi:ATP-dependent Clp protease adaptor protein ClpS